MGFFDKYNDSNIFENPCPPGCETCCPLDIQLAYNPETNILTLTYIYDDATVVREVDLSDLQEALTIGLTYDPNTSTLTLSGTYAGVPFSSSVVLSNIQQGLLYSEDNITYYAVDGTLLTTEYIIVATGNPINLTMPASPVLGQMYKVYPSGNTVNIFANAGQNIAGGASIVASGQNAVIIQYIKTNQWGVINL